MVKTYTNIAEWQTEPQISEHKIRPKTKPD